MLLWWHLFHFDIFVYALCVSRGTRPYTYLFEMNLLLEKINNNQHKTFKLKRICVLYILNVPNCCYSFMRRCWNVLRQFILPFLNHSRGLNCRKPPSTVVNCRKLPINFWKLPNCRKTEEPLFRQWCCHTTVSHSSSKFMFVGVLAHTGWRETLKCGYALPVLTGQIAP